VSCKIDQLVTDVREVKGWYALSPEEVIELALTEYINNTTHMDIPLQVEFLDLTE
jgi:hypothetical protein